MVPNWPTELDGIKVVLISDLHFGSHFIDNDKVSLIVDKVNATNPDLILLLGDYVFTEPKSRGGIFFKVMAPFFRPHVDSGKFISQLSLLKAKLGVFAVLGNHDWYFDGNKIKSQLEGTGFKVFENSSAHVMVRGTTLWLAGVADAWERVADVATTLQPIPSGQPIILLTHNPDVFPLVPSRVNLTVAGHTHGGQVVVPFYGPLIVPSKFGKKYSKGLIVEDGRDLFVTSGIGTSMIPIRFLVPPEISVLILRSPKTVK